MSLKRLARRLPSPLYRLLQRVHRRITGRAPPLPLHPNPGPLLTELAPRIATIPGWLNADDLAHLTLVLETQSACGMRGDLLEIGCYHGRTAAVLALHLRDGERLLLADAFDLPLPEPYGDTPTPEKVRANLARIVPRPVLERVEVVRAYSRDLALPGEMRVRLAHVDGGHDEETALHDLALCAEHLLPGGVLILDDHAHPQYPGVGRAARAFLAQRPDFCVLADLNRLGALGRKLYLVRPAEG